MKIIIAGAGNVGTHLAKLLSREKQDIILMDDDEEKLSALSANFDLLTVAASPSSISGLKEVGVKEADLFIAVTPDESRNMTACMLATNLGAKKTVARIDNYEYLLPKNKEFFQKLGVDSLIYPEMLAAKEIVSSMRMSWVRQWWEFCGGSLVLIGTKMREKAEILNIPLHQLGGPNIPYHVVAIKRGTETIIPRGDDVIKLHDIVYFTTTRKYIPYIRKIAGKEDYADVRNVMIMGGSRIAVRTAQYVPDYMQVKIVDNDLNRCNRLTELLDDKTMIINGDGRDMDLLVEEGLKNTEAFVALTGNSETNILACLAAKRMGVSKTVAEVENIDYIGMAENAISYLVNNKLNEELTYYIAHRRLSINSTLYDLYNPINFIVDYSVRDVCEYAKNVFFDNKEKSYMVYEYIKNAGFNYDEIILLLARFLYPTYYFDMIQDCIDNKKQENDLWECIRKYVSRVDEYEAYLKNIFEYFSRVYNIELVEWIITKK